jgi:hypothetical protein
MAPASFRQLQASGNSVMPPIGLMMNRVVEKNELETVSSRLDLVEGCQEEATAEGLRWLL